MTVSMPPLEDGKPEVLRRLERAAQAFQSPAENAASEPDPLAAALVDIARHHGVRTATTVLTHGLPLVNGRLAAEHVPLAGERAGLAAEIRPAGLETVQDAELPVIALIDDGSADIVWSIDRDSNKVPTHVEVSEPGRDATRTRIAVAEYARAGCGRIIFIRPASSAKTAAEEVLPVTQPGWLLKAFSASRKAYGEAILATVAINVLALAMPLYTMNIYDRVLPNAAAETLWALSLGIVLATSFDLLIKTLRGRFVDAAGQRGDVLLANHIFARLLGAKLTASGSTGVRANTLREYETLREFFGSATLTAFGDIPFLVLFLAMIAVVAGPLVLVPLATIPLVIAIGWWTQKRIGTLTETQFRDAAQKNAVAVETIGGLETIKAAAGESWAAARWERAVADSIRTGNALRNVSAIGMNTIFAAQTLIQVLMIVAGFYMVASGSLTTGGLIAATMLAGRALQPVGQAAGLIARLHQARIAYRLLDAIVRAPQEREDGDERLAPERIEGAIAFDAVTLAYDKDSPPVLRDVTFTVAPGEKVAIVGSIGTGKTTLLKLIHGLIAPTSGRVLIDSIPVGHIEPSLLRAGIGLALQDAEVFQGTLRENITMGDPTVPDGLIVLAARSSLALDWIGRLPKGLDTPVRERGTGLSSGQKQSLTLARALVRQPPILLLDEPTSTLDQTTEAQVVERLRVLIAQRTVIVVTHRPAMLDLVDRIIVLDAGRKILDGPKASVLASIRARTTRAAAPPASVPARTGP